ncbi:extensin-like [Seriola dumerili]|uniref:extensin-like n=1 Tax=Seriola dumerili TaxID=41447 RepID=UPI000BBEC4C8|nr:extensin-like [Seriola dumerili]
MELTLLRLHPTPPHASPPATYRAPLLPLNHLCAPFAFSPSLTPPTPFSSTYTTHLPHPLPPPPPPPHTPVPSSHLRASLTFSGANKSALPGTVPYHSPLLPHINTPQLHIAPAPPQTTTSSSSTATPRPALTLDRRKSVSTPTCPRRPSIAPLSPVHLRSLNPRPVISSPLRQTPSPVLCTLLHLALSPTATTPLRLPPRACFLPTPTFLPPAPPTSSPTPSAQATNLNPPTHHIPRPLLLHSISTPSPNHPTPLPTLPSHTDSHHRPPPCATSQTPHLRLTPNLILPTSHTTPYRRL